MVKRILSIGFIIGATSLVASCLHQQETKQPYLMYQEPRQIKNMAFKSTVEPLGVHILSKNNEKIAKKYTSNNELIFKNGEMAVAGVSVVLMKTKYIEKKEKKSYKYEVTDKEIEMLQRISESEATGADIESKKNIVSTIFNRVESNSFPSTIEKVIFQKSQFSPIEDGRFKSVKITEETKQAVEEVLLDGVTHDCLYFFNIKDVQSAKIKKWIKNKLSFEFKDDAGHSFYKEK